MDELNSNSFKPDSELIQEILQLSRKVTSLEEANEELQSTKEFLLDERERSSAIFQAIPLPSFIFKKSGEEFQLEEYNIRADQVTLGRIKHFRGKGPLELYPGMPHIEEDLRKSFEEKKIVRREVEYKSDHTGIKVYLILTYSYVPPDKVSMFSVDITDLKEAELAFQRSDEFNKGIVNSTADAILIANRDANITFVNTTAEKVFKADKEQMLAKNIFEYFINAEDCVCNNLKELQDHLTGESNVEGVARREDGKEFPVELNAVDLDTSSGKQLCVFIRDITERKEAEHARSENTRLKTVTALAATMSHEFNTPLGIILGTVDLIKMKKMNYEEILGHLEKIPRQITKIHDLITKFHTLRKVKQIDYAAGMKILDIHVPGHEDIHMKEIDEE